MDCEKCGGPEHCCVCDAILEDAKVSTSAGVPGYVPTDEAMELTVAMTKLDTKEILYATTAALMVRKDGRKWAKLLIDNFKK